MGRTLDKNDKTSGKSQAKLRLVRADEEAGVERPKAKSALAREMNVFADELDKQIAALLDS